MNLATPWASCSLSISVCGKIILIYLGRCLPQPLVHQQYSIVSHFASLNQNFISMAMFLCDRPKLCAIAIFHDWIFIFRCSWVTWVSFCKQFAFYSLRSPKSTMLLWPTYESLRTFCCYCLSNYHLVFPIDECWNLGQHSHFEAGISVLPYRLFETDALTLLKIVTWPSLSLAISQGAFIRYTWGELVAIGNLGRMDSWSGKYGQVLLDSDVVLALSMLKNVLVFCGGEYWSVTCRWITRFSLSFGIR